MSPRLAIPVDKITGFPVLAADLISGKLTMSIEEILNPAQPTSSSWLNDGTSKGVEKISIKTIRISLKFLKIVKVKHNFV